MGAAVALRAIAGGLRFKKVVFLTPPANYVRELARSARDAGASEPLLTAALDCLRRRVPDLDQIDSLKMADNLTMPGLIVVAGNDRILSPDDGRRLAGVWSGSKLVELAAASHRSVLRDSDVIAQILDLVWRWT